LKILSALWLVSSWRKGRSITVLGFACICFLDAENFPYWNGKF
jgi:hypothetical protein